MEQEYWPGAIAWADKNHNNAWSKAIDYFDAVLSGALRTNDYSNIRAAGETYKIRILKLLKLYKEAKGLKDKEEFFRSLDKEKKDDDYDQRNFLF